MWRTAVKSPAFDLRGPLIFPIKSLPRMMLSNNTLGTKDPYL